jgi:hypothetical protein
MTASNNLALDYEPEISSSASEGFRQIGYQRTPIANTTMVSSITFFSPLSSIAKEFISKVKTFASLNDNWDSYGAVPPSGENVDRAISFIKKADGNLLPLYFVAPGPNGEIVIEFNKNNKEAAAYFHPDGSTELLLHEGDNYVLEGTLEENYKNLLSYING